MTSKRGTLYVIATPIGNMEDVTYRAIRVLGEVDALACEDTRLTRKILSRYEIKTPRNLLSYREQNETKAGERILGLLEEGMSVGLCSDAGYPGISDPGYRVVSEALERDFRVEVIPGAGAVTAALVSSGLPTSSYTFKGFPPRRPGVRKRFLREEAESPHTLVLFESPHRIKKLLVDALEVLGNRKAAVCVELTKRFEKVHRGYLSELIDQFENGAVKGEIAVVIAGSNPKLSMDAEGREDESVEDR